MIKRVRTGRGSRVQFRAVVRFSLIDHDWKGWRATNTGAFTSPEDYRDSIWGDRRMETRFRIFALAVPVYQSMARDHDFRVLVQYSPDLPERHLSRLRALATGHDVLRLVPTPRVRDAREAVERDLREEGRTAPVVMLRIDDDDLLAGDFLDQLVPYIVPAHMGWVVSLGRGLVAQDSDQGLRNFRELSLPFNSMGQAYLGRYERRRGRLELSSTFSHRQVHRYVPSIVDSRTISWVQVWHADQDTRVGTDPDRMARKMATQLRKMPWPQDDIADLTAKFPTIEPDLARVAQGLDACGR